MKFAFVILHYQTYEDTVECVTSLSDLTYSNIEIVIIDNASPNKSGDLLRHKYANEQHIHFLASPANVGFAKGNNIGFNFAKHQLQADFIALFNNDTIITDRDFVSKIIDKYRKDPFHILGPRILSTIDGKDQNPRGNKDWDANKDLKENIHVLESRIKHYKKFKRLAQLELDVPFTQLKKKILKKTWLPSSDPVKYDHLKEYRNVKIQGCALLFSPLYLVKYEGLFDKTFMYGEESILHFISKRDGLTTLYYPEVFVYHKESSSTSTVMTSKKRRRIFYYKNFIQSRTELLKLMKDEL